ncbi:LacI family DNA-binding transcriptional regulator [Alteribacillus sp. JSM 102045]|uniref:LacI family DNA-binding transcriptional regulator n=1 Tax=Alteribacillus sp. JSM 102045 TaxID=1562101 RepID=UPI0035C17356
MTTIKDIAKEAGVSVTTVSRALNGYYDVNENTRKKIQQIAAELNYSPNSVARSLVTSKTKTIGLLVSELSRSALKDSFMVEIMGGLNAYAGEAGYDLILFSTDSAKQRLKSYSQLCRERQVEGAIMLGMKKDDPYLTEVIESNIPCVLIDIEMSGENVGYVTTDNEFGAQTAVKHLINLGHRNIAMVNGHDQALVSQHRLKGYKKELQEAGITFRQHWVVDGQFQEETAEKEAEKLLQEYPEISALFCASDLMALGAMRSAKKLGRNIPESLSIAGFDDIVLASYAHPPLTTVAQDKYKMGYEAGKLLLHILNGDPTKRVTILDNHLVIRNTTTANNQKVPFN